MNQEQTIQRALKILEARMRNTPALASPDAVRNYLRLLLHDRGHEVFVCVFLDSQHRVIASEELFRGTLTQALKQALALIDTRVLDHFVVAGSQLVSFAERGLL